MAKESKISGYIWFCLWPTIQSKVCSSLSAHSAPLGAALGFCSFMICKIVVVRTCFVIYNVISFIARSKILVFQENCVLLWLDGMFCSFVWCLFDLWVYIWCFFSDCFALVISFIYDCRLSKSFTVTRPGLLEIFISSSEVSLCFLFNKICASMFNIYDI